MRVKTYFAFFSLIFSSSLVFAQMPEIKNLLRTPEVGTWSKYKLNGKMFFGYRELYVAVVKEERIDEKMHLWYEFTMIGTEDTSTVKVLVLAEPIINLESKRVIVKAGKRTAQEVPAVMVRMGTSLGFKFALGFNPEEMVASIQGGLRDKSKIIPHGNILMGIAGKQVKANYFVLKAYNGKAIELWLSDDVPLFSFVKMDITKAQAELNEWGYSGAIDRIGESFRPLGVSNLLKTLIKN